MGKKPVAPRSGVHSDHEETVGAAGVADTRYRCSTVSMHDIGPTVDEFRNEVVTSAVKILYCDGFNSGIKKSGYNGIDVPGHFNAGARPILCAEFRCAPAPAPGTSLDIGNYEYRA